MNTDRRLWPRCWEGRATFLAGLLAALVISPVFAASVSLNPASDAFVTTGASGNLINNNYGSAGALSVAAAGSAQGEFQSVLQFSLAGARASFDSQFGAGQWSLQSVTLQLTAAAPNNAIFNPSAAGQFGVSWMQNDSWTEGSGNPSAPALSGINFTSLQGTFISGGDEIVGTFSFDGSTTATATYTLGLTSGFAADLLAGNDVSLRMFAADSVMSYVFDSRNFPTAASRPVLTVSAVPEPGSVGLGGIALLGAVLLRRWTGKSEFRKPKLKLENRLCPHAHRSRLHRG